MISICIKTNNKNVISYLLDNISIINGGLLSTTSSKNVLNIRPVLTLDKNVKIIGGTGSKENPYQINTVWK